MPDGLRTTRDTFVTADPARLLDRLRWIADVDDENAWLAPATGALLKNPQNVPHRPPSRELDAVADRLARAQRASHDALPESR